MLSITSRGENSEHCLGLAPSKNSGLQPDASASLACSAYWSAHEDLHPDHPAINGRSYCWTISRKLRFEFGPHGRSCTCTPSLTPGFEAGASAVSPRGEKTKIGWPGYLGIMSLVRTTLAFRSPPLPCEVAVSRRPYEENWCGMRDLHPRRIVGNDAS